MGAEPALSEAEGAHPAYSTCFKSSGVAFLSTDLNGPSTSLYTTWSGSITTIAVSNPRSVSATTRAIDSTVGLLICACLFVLSRLHSLLGGPPQPSLRATTPPRGGATPLRPKRVLCIKTYGLGNIAMLLPILGAIKRGIPGVEIDFLTRPYPSQ